MIAGKMVPPQCSLGYAAPEVVLAFSERKDIKASAAMDIWSLGVMVYEALTQQPAVDPFGGVDFCCELARGEAEFPWEEGDQDDKFQGSRARKLVEACLARNPESRATAASLVASISNLSKHSAAS
jgi:serine/threonine protein kinase